MDAPIQAKFKDAHNIDSIFISAPGWPAGFSMERYDEYVQHTIENGFTALSNTVTNGGESTEVVMERMREFNQFLADRPDRYMQIKPSKTSMSRGRNRRSGFSTTSRAWMHLVTISPISRSSMISGAHGPVRLQPEQRLCRRE